MPDSLPVSTEFRFGSRRSRGLAWFVAAFAALVFVVWLLNTPEGLLGKADAIGYAICHRIETRSFYIGDRPCPLCARCMGIYLGALIGLVGMAVFGRGRAGQLPPRGLLLVLFGFVGLMGLDGLNSYVGFFPGVPQLYEPQNWLRAVTGMLNGLAMAGLVYPILNQTLWQNWEDRPALANGRQLLGLLAVGAMVIALLLSNNAVVLYPLALLSVVGVVAMLVALNTTLLLVIFRRENTAQGLRGALLPLVAGFALAFTQIGLVDAARFAVFQSWGGLPLPG
jgi:uncharacterized membrane protein